MMDLRTKNRRLCEKLRAKIGFNCGQTKSEPDKKKKTKTKTKIKKNGQNTFSMIKFYESIPNYEEIRDLPDYDFTERLSLLKKIHCDLSQPLATRVLCERTKSVGSCRRKTSAKLKRDSPIKRNTISPSLCRSFSKTSLNDTEEIGSQPLNQTLRLSSAGSMSISTPTPVKRLQLLRERLSSGVKEHEFKSDLKLKHSSPMCSPVFSEIKFDYSPDFHEIESHPCDLYFNYCHSNIPTEKKFSNPSVGELQSPPKRITNFETPIQCFEWRSNCTELKPSLKEAAIKRRRAKSCPKEFFGTPKPCLNFQHCDEVLNSSSTKQEHDDSTPSQMPGDSISSISTQQRPKSKTLSKTKPKTPNSMDEYISSKMVRSNLAANLRRKWSRQKIENMTEEKLKATLTVSKCIPKCHRWNVKSTPGWKTFTSEDLETEKRLREARRREEQRLRQHAHSMNMNIMRARVESAQLLLEGRALSAKS